MKSKKGINLLICLIAIVLVIPIGIGALVGSCSSSDPAGGPTPEEVKVDVTLSETNVSFTVGQTESLTATASDESDSFIFNWSTSAENIVSVTKDVDSKNTCVLTAKGAGTATVTVSIIDTKKFKVLNKATCEVEVISDTILFSVDEVVLSLDGENTATVTAVAPNNQAVIWSSEDESIATVENGVITAVKAGKVNIVAKSGIIEAQLPVTIYNTIFTLEEVKLLSSGAEEQITATVGNITEATWTSQDEDIATVDASGKVSGKKLGMTTVTATCSDGFTASCVVIVSDGSKEPFELIEGKKAAAAKDPGNWYYLCESDIVDIGAIPTMDNGVIALDVDNVGTSGANFFYLRYQPDADGDVVYKHTLYMYSDTDDVLIQVNGVDNYLKRGINKIEVEFTSSSPNDGNPYQIKFKGMGVFYLIPIFEETSRVEKMTLNETEVLLDLTDNTTFTLTANIPGQENPSIEWVSSNPDVAIVENGVVTAVSVGYTVVTATCGNLSVSCNISVKSGNTVDGEELASGNKSATLGSPGSWFYLADGAAELFTTPVIDSGNNIYLDIKSVDSATKKYVYLRYQPETLANYKATVTINFTGVDGSVVDISGGDLAAQSCTLNNGINTFEFTFNATETAPFQLKFYTTGSFVVNVTFTNV